MHAIGKLFTIPFVRVFRHLSFYRGNETPNIIIFQIFFENIELRSYIPRIREMAAPIYVNNYTEGELSPSEGGRIQGGDQRDASRQLSRLPPPPQINSINRVKRQPSIIALAQSRVAGDRPSRYEATASFAVKPNTSIFINKHLSGPRCALASRERVALPFTGPIGFEIIARGGITRKVSESRARWNACRSGRLRRNVEDLPKSPRVRPHSPNCPGNIRALYLVSIANSNVSTSFVKRWEESWPFLEIPSINGLMQLRPVIHWLDADEETASDTPGISDKIAIIPDKFKSH